MISVQDMLSHGYALTPVPFGEKGPKDKAWNQRQNVITDVKDAHRLQGFNVGLCHAYSTPFTCCFDLDDVFFSDTWLAKRGVKLADLLNADDAVIVSSGRPNSLKPLYRLSEGIEPLVSQKVNKPDGNCGLEMRCGTKARLTAQDIIPPSRHPLGTTYKFIGRGNPLGLPVLPDPLLRIWEELNAIEVTKKKPSAQGPMYVAVPETPRQVAEVTRALSLINADCPYEVWRNTVWAILSTGWSCAEDLAYRWSASAPHRFDETAFWLVANSYDPDLENPMTIATVYYYAKHGGQPWLVS
jgi:hypothetical protein